MTKCWSIEEEADAADLAAISDGVVVFGRAEAAGGEARPIACFFREEGDIIAGATGRTEFRRLFVNYLWVAEERRGQGLGTEALRRIEAAAAKRGCQDALIETLSDRNARLYENLGYVPLARIPGYVGRFTRHILVKPLTGSD